MASALAGGGLGLVQLARGRPGEALPLLERALVVRTQSAVAGDQQEPAEIRWGLARARALAEVALEAYRSLGGESTVRVREIVRWLATTAHTQR